MKIIGHAANGYLVEASEDEIANLMGYYTGYCAKEDQIEIEPGLVFEVSKEYEKLAWIKRRHETFDWLVKELRKAADSIESMRPTFDRLADGE